MVEEIQKQLEAEEVVTEDLDVLEGDKKTGEPISISTTRVYASGLTERVKNFLLRNSADWTDVWTRYECFTEDVENVIASYGLEVEPAEPELELYLDGNTETVASQERAIRIDDMENIDSIVPMKHEWSWEPTDGVRFQVEYKDGSRLYGTNHYRQNGVYLSVDEKGAQLTDDLIEVMETWFGDRKRYKSKSEPEEEF